MAELMKEFDVGQSSPRTVVCIGCGAEFVTCWPKQVFCVKKCRQATHNAAPLDRGECSIEGCDRRVKARGVCNTHYLRLQNHGSADDPRMARRRRFFWSRVEKTDTCWNWVGQTDDAGYGRVHLGYGKSTSAHRFAYSILIGDVPKELDHRCLNRACVNPQHLRPATRSQNLENLSGARSDSSTGIRGVWRHKATGKWSAQVCKNGKSHWLGLFESIEDAEAAAVARRKELFTYNERDRVVK